MIIISKVKCPICGLSFDNTKEQYVHIGNRYYHLNCCTEEEIYKDKIFQYIKKLWGEYTYSKINNQIENFCRIHKYKIKDIYNDLVYFFEVEKGNPMAYPNTIGIVPFIHDKAQKYYNNLSKKEMDKKLLAEQLKKQVHTEIEIITITNIKQEKKKRLFEIEEGE